jgi:hypothetical protein
VLTWLDANDFWTNSFALNPEGTAFSILRQHPASLFAFFSTVAQFRVYQYNLENDPDNLYFQDQAVKRINELLEQENAAGTVSDYLMMAVAVMVNKEVGSSLKEYY